MHTNIKCKHAANDRKYTYILKYTYTRIIKNCEFKKGSRDRSPKQKVRKQEL